MSPSFSVPIPPFSPYSTPQSLNGIPDHRTTTNALSMPLSRILPPLLASLALTAPLFAQGDIVIDDVEKLHFDRPESWAMKRTAALLMFTSLGPPEDREAGELEFSLEGIWNPNLSTAERTVGFKGTKEEDMNRLLVIPRPRVAVGIGWNTTLEASYIPPVEIDGIEPHFFALALERPIVHHCDWTLGLRIFGHTGTAQGDITCSSSDARDMISGCLEPSNDEVDVTYYGAALTGGYHLPEHIGGDIFFGAYATYLDMEFQVDALLDSRFGPVSDKTKQLTDGWIYAVTLGYTRPINDCTHFALEAFYSPLDVMRGDIQGGDTSTENDYLFNLRAMVTYTY